MANLIAATDKSETDQRLQQLAAAIVDVRERSTILSDWRQPLDDAYLLGLGYDAQQIAELTWFIDLAHAWTDMIGVGGTMSASDGELFERMLVQIYGLGGMTGIASPPAA